VLNTRTPHEIIVAVPVAPVEMIEQLSGQCHHVECLLAPPDFGSVGAFYRDFRQVDDEEAVRLLRGFRAADRGREAVAP
jgi:predicted phosphoribosyltransferase